MNYLLSSLFFFFWHNKETLEEEKVKEKKRKRRKREGEFRRKMLRFLCSLLVCPFLTSPLPKPCYQNNSAKRDLCSEVQRTSSTSNIYMNLRGGGDTLFRNK